MKTNIKGLKLTYLSTCLVGLFSSHVMAAEQNQQSKSVKDDAIEKVTVVASRQAYQGNFCLLYTSDAADE